MTQPREGSAPSDDFTAPPDPASLPDNAFRRWRNAGFRHVHPIIPPGAKIMPGPNCEALRAAAGKAPGAVWPGSEGFSGIPWRQGEKADPGAPGTAQRCYSYERSCAEFGAGVGVVASTTPGLDVDVLDEALAEKIRVLIQSQIDVTPWRVGQAPKLLIPFRLALDAEPFEKLKIEIPRPGKTKSWGVEFLGCGQQWVAQGTHPGTMKPYSWHAGHPAELGRDKLPEITPAGAIDLMNRIARLLKREKVEHFFGRGGARGRKAGPGEEFEVPPPETLLCKERDLDLLAQAIDAIPNDMDYDAWIRVGLAIKGAYGPGRAMSGFEAFRGFSNRWHDGEEPEGDAYLKQKWGELSPQHLGASYIFRLAETHGWPGNQERIRRDLRDAGIADPDVAEAWRASQGDAANDAAGGTANGAANGEAPPSGAANGPDAGTPPPIYDLEAAKTERWMADALVALRGHTLRWISELNAWATFDTADGWSVERDPSAGFNVAKAVARAMGANGAFGAGEIKAWGGSRTLFGAESIARRDTRLVAGLARWDAEPWELHTPGGVVDLKTGKLLRPEPSRMGLLRTAATPAPEGARPELLLTLLNFAFDGDAEAIGYVQRAFGLALVGTVIEHCLIVLLGAAQTGKTTALEAVQHALGSYAIACASDFWMASAAVRHTEEFARLKGKRIAITSEIDPSARFDLARLKKLTGGDTLTGGFKHRATFDFRPSHTALIALNAMPHLAGADDAIRRRLRVIRYNRIPAVCDPTLQVRLQAEAPEILRWLIDGCLAWQADGCRLGMAPGEFDATEDAADEGDPLGTWFRERVEITRDPKDSAAFKALLADYTAWLRTRRGEQHFAGTETAFGTWLKQHAEARGAKFSAHVVGQDGARGRGYRGMSLRPGKPDEGASGHEQPWQ
jgi:putative DNA primase/helicase